VKVHWTDTARDHLRAIHAYIARNSPQYALRVVDRLTRRSEQIADFPLSGQEVAEFGVPQIRQVLQGPFRIIYYIKPGQIDVLAVIHGAQQIPPTQ
jgi:plasmid stabilization system protein ParE